MRNVGPQVSASVLGAPKPSNRMLSPPGSCRLEFVSEDGPGAVQFALPVHPVVGAVTV